MIALMPYFAMLSNMRSSRRMASSLYLPNEGMIDSGTESKLLNAKTRMAVTPLAACSFIITATSLSDMIHLSPA